MPVWKVVWCKGTKITFLDKYRAEWMDAWRFEGFIAIEVKRAPDNILELADTDLMFEHDNGWKNDVGSMSKTFASRWTMSKSVCHGQEV